MTGGPSKMAMADSCSSWGKTSLLGRTGTDHSAFPSRRSINPTPRSFVPKRKPLSLGAETLLLLSFPSPPSSSGGAIGPVSGDTSYRATGTSTSPWDDKPFELLPSGKKAYLDEQDVVTFLDPPRELVPLDPSSFNPASYLWKKISDIPEERRHRLLYLLNPRLISAAWAIAGARYDNPKLAEQSSSGFLTGDEADTVSLEYWNCCKSGGPMPLALINCFKTALFRQDGELYGQFIGGSFLGRMASSWSPLYFTVQQTQEVMPTEQPCDLAYEFGDGLLYINDYPQGFPRSAKHPWPFNDQVVVYVRHAGPGVMVGQAWREGFALEQVPKKLCSEILMVKDYSRFYD